MFSQLLRAIHTLKPRDEHVVFTNYMICRPLFLPVFNSPKHPRLLKRRRLIVRCILELTFRYVLRLGAGDCFRRPPEFRAAALLCLGKSERIGSGFYYAKTNLLGNVNWFKHLAVKKYVGWLRKSPGWKMNHLAQEHEWSVRKRYCLVRENESSGWRARIMWL